MINSEQKSVVKMCIGCGHPNLKHFKQGSNGAVPPRTRMVQIRDAELPEVRERKLRKTINALRRKLIMQTPPPQSPMDSYGLPQPQTNPIPIPGGGPTNQTIPGYGGQQRTGRGPVDPKEFDFSPYERAPDPESSDSDEPESG